MPFAETVGFMVVDRRDLGHACVAATSFRRYQPHMRLCLFVRGPLPAPWIDLSAGCFDYRINLHDLPIPIASSNVLLETTKTSNVASALSELFKHGVQHAIYLNHWHVWFNALPPWQKTDGPLALLASEQERGLACAHQRLALLSLSRTDGLDQVLAACKTPLPVAADLLGFQTKSNFQAIVGLAREDLRRSQLKFDSSGRLKWGSQPVLSACLGELSEQPVAQVIDILWLELLKWYDAQLERFDQRVL